MNSLEVSGRHFEVGDQICMEGGLCNRTIKSFSGDDVVLDSHHGETKIPTYALKNFFVMGKEEQDDVRPLFMKKMFPNK